MSARRFARLVSLPVLVVSFLWVGAATALAQGAEGIDHNDQIVLNGQLVVPKGDTVGTAVILNGPARIYGTVQETLFVANGRVDIAGTIDQDVVVLNGSVHVRSTAHIGGDLVTQGTATVDPGATIDGSQQNVATRFDAHDLGFASRFAWWLGYSVSTLVFGLLLLLLFPGLDATVVTVWRARAGSAVGWGAAVFFLLPIVAVLFLVTIVGIPLGLFMLLALGLVYTVGYVVGVHVLGRLLVKPPTSRYLAFLVGWAILRVVGLVPILGGFAFLIVALIGLGVLLVGARRVDATAASTSTSMTPPPPPPPSPLPS
jgi:cytoskeletal protein CcmA (bactofilin family)